VPTELDLLQALVDEAEEEADLLLALVPHVPDGQVRVDGYLAAMDVLQEAARARQRHLVGGEPDDR
jgi:hypothetical protein